MACLRNLAGVWTEIVVSCRGPRTALRDDAVQV